MSDDTPDTPDTPEPLTGAAGPDDDTQVQSSEWVEPLAQADRVEDLVDDDGFLSGSPAKDEAIAADEAIDQ